MHAVTRFRRLNYDATKVARAFADLVTRGQHKYAFLVAQNGDGRIVGALIGVLEQHIFSDQLSASVMHFDVLPEARMGGYGVRLLKAFELWAANRNVVEIGSASIAAPSCMRSRASRGAWVSKSWGELREGGFHAAALSFDGLSNIEIQSIHLIGEGQKCRTRICRNSMRCCPRSC